MASSARSTEPSFEVVADDEQVEEGDGSLRRKVNEDQLSIARVTPLLFSISLKTGWHCQRVSLRVMETVPVRLLEMALYAEVCPVARGESVVVNGIVEHGGLRRHGGGSGICGHGGLGSGGHAD
jgi:hypothetical protein